jgi:Flp pilus assembly pilin Flp
MDMLSTLYLRATEFIARKREEAEEGQGMVEYALILVLIAIVVIVILIFRLIDHTIIITRATTSPTTTVVVPATTSPTTTVVVPATTAPTTTAPTTTAPTTTAPTTTGTTITAKIPFMVSIITGFFMPWYLPAYNRWLGIPRFPTLQKEWLPPD